MLGSGDAVYVSQGQRRSCWIRAGRESGCGQDPLAQGKSKGHLAQVIRIVTRIAPFDRLVEQPARPLDDACRNQVQHRGNDARAVEDQAEIARHADWECA